MIPATFGIGTLDPLPATAGQGLLLRAETLLWPSNWAKVGLLAGVRIMPPQICRDMPQRPRLELPSGIMLMCPSCWRHACGIGYGCFGASTGILATSVIDYWHGDRGRRQGARGIGARVRVRPVSLARAQA